MKELDIVDEILDLFRRRGSEAYLGEPVSQQEHALETAHLAVLDGAPPALVAAALLHDIGHLLGGEAEDNPAERGVDARHEEAGHRWLAKYFGPEVTEAVRLHVVAKRYLCAVEKEYLRSLSPASVRSLELQGGPLVSEEVRDFEASGYSREAVRLRRWDDRAKTPGLEVPGLTAYAGTLRSVAR